LCALMCMSTFCHLAALTQAEKKKLTDMKEHLKDLRDHMKKDFHPENLEFHEAASYLRNGYIFEKISHGLQENTCHLSEEVQSKEREKLCVFESVSPKGSHQYGLQWKWLPMYKDKDTPNINWQELGTMMSNPQLCASKKMTKIKKYIIEIFKKIFPYIYGDAFKKVDHLVQEGEECIQRIKAISDERLRHLVSKWQSDPQKMLKMVGAVQELENFDAKDSLSNDVRECINAIEPSLLDLKHVLHREMANAERNFVKYSEADMLYIERLRKVDEGLDEAFKNVFKKLASLIPQEVRLKAVQQKGDALVASFQKDAIDIFSKQLKKLEKVPFQEIKLSDIVDTEKGLLDLQALINAIKFFTNEESQHTLHKLLRMSQGAHPVLDANDVTCIKECAKALTTISDTVAKSMPPLGISGILKTDSLDIQLQSFDKIKEASIGRAINTLKKMQDMRANMPFFADSNA